MHLSPPPQVALVVDRSKAVVLLLLICCWLLLPFLDSVIVLGFVVHYFVSILVLRSSRWGRESWLLCFVCLPCVLWLHCGSSSRCHGCVCSLWLFYFLIILTYYFWMMTPFYRNSQANYVLQTQNKSNPGTYHFNIWFFLFPSYFINHTRNTTTYVICKMKKSNKVYQLTLDWKRSDIYVWQWNTKDSSKHLNQSCSR